MYVINSMLRSNPLFSKTKTSPGDSVLHFSLHLFNGYHLWCIIYQSIYEVCLLSSSLERNFMESFIFPEQQFANRLVSGFTCSKAMSSKVESLLLYSLTCSLHIAEQYRIGDTIVPVDVQSITQKSRVAPIDFFVKGVRARPCCCIIKQDWFYRCCEKILLDLIC